ncbi:MAG: hypothetical protein L3K17_05245 [Thermoplasmata archaeon]|nr:hypothetical protein [Thermoplasmata archaeon]
MNDGPLRALLLGTALVLAAAAVYAGANSASAVPLATTAALCVAAFAALSIAGATRFVRQPFTLPVADPLVALRSAFREGALGRQRIIVALAELERQAHGRAAITADNAAQFRAEEQPPAAFRRWVGERLDELEAST